MFLVQIPHVPVFVFKGKEKGLSSSSATYLSVLFQLLKKAYCTGKLMKMVFCKAKKKKKGGKFLIYFHREQHYPQAQEKTA